MSVACILVAAGRGERLGVNRPKAFVEIGGRPLIWYAMLAVSRSARVNDVVAVVPPEFVDDLPEAVPAAAGPGTVTAVAGGETRQDSVARGLAALPDQADVVLVHDAARCLAPPDLYDAVATEVVNRHDAVVPGLAVVDTLKRVDGTGLVIATPERSELRAVQTPQGFRRAVLARAHAAADQRGDTDAPDDAWLVERIGVAVYVVPGHEDAFKITRPQDLVLAQAVLEQPGRRDDDAARPAASA